MDIQTIRSKYKSILQEDSNKNKTYDQKKYYLIQDQQSQTQWKRTENNQRHKRILTQTSHNFNNLLNSKYNELPHKQPKKRPNQKKQNSKLSTEQQIISLKQKIAQSIVNIERKDKQINEFENLLMKKNEQIKEQQKSINQLQNIINEKDSLILCQKKKQEALQKIISQKNQFIEEIKVENSLLNKHIELYTKQIENLNSKIKGSQKQFQNLQKQVHKSDNLKSKIQRHKDDIKRLQFLLSDHSLYSPIVVALEGKHFLGKPSKYSKQLQYWYPSALVNGIQFFLKKEQVGYGNKLFTQNLAKFIYGLLQRKQKNCERKCKSKFTSRLKQFERRKNHILNIFQQQPFDEQKSKITQRNSRLCTSSLRKTTPLNGNSEIKSRDFSICLDRSLCFEKQTLPSAKKTKKNKSTGKNSFVFQGINTQKQVKFNSQTERRNAILQIIDSFCEGLDRLLKYQNMVLALQKIRDLQKWLRQSIKQIYKKQTKKQFGNQTGKWRTVGDIELQSNGD